MRPAAAGLLVLLGAATSGCRGSLAPFQTAHTLPKGGFQVAIEGGAVGAISEVSGENAGNLNVAGRYALSDRVEIGARVGTGRPELMAKFRLDRGGASDVAYSLAPSVSAFLASATGVTGVSLEGHVPLLVGIPFGRHELVLGPAIHLGHVINVDTAVWGFVASPGLSVGFSVRPLPWLAILPEIAVAYPLFHASPSGPAWGGGIPYQVGIAILAGSPMKEAQPARKGASPYAPRRYESTARAASRPSRIAHTTSD